MTPVDVLLGALREIRDANGGMVGERLDAAMAEYERLTGEGAAAPACDPVSDHAAIALAAHGMGQESAAASLAALRVDIDRAIERADREGRTADDLLGKLLQAEEDVAALRAERDEARAALDEITRRWQTPNGRWCVLCDHCICTEDCPVSIAKRGRRSAPAATPPTATPPKGTP